MGKHSKSTRRKIHETIRKPLAPPSIRIPKKKRRLLDKASKKVVADILNEV